MCKLVKEIKHQSHSTFPTDRRSLGGLFIRANACTTCRAQRVPRYVYLYRGAGYLSKRHSPSGRRTRLFHRPPAYWSAALPTPIFMLSCARCTHHLVITMRYNTRNIFDEHLQNLSSLVVSTVLSGQALVSDGARICFTSFIFFCPYNFVIKNLFHVKLLKSQF